MRSIKDNNFTVRLNEEEKNYLKARADELNKSCAEIIRSLLAYDKEMNILNEKYKKFY